jgi:hypothetical protein
MQNQGTGDFGMKRLALFGSIALIITLSVGCMKMRTNTSPPSLTDDAVPRLNIREPVSLHNSAPQVGEIVIGGWTGWTVHANLYKYTESTIGAVKNALEMQNIQVADDATKILELSVYEAPSKQNTWNFSVTTALRVRTGDGYEHLCRQHEPRKWVRNDFRNGKHLGQVHHEDVRRQ